MNRRGVFIVTLSCSVAHSSVLLGRVSKFVTQGRDKSQISALGVRAHGFSMSFPTSSGRGRGGCVWNISLTCVPIFCLNAGARTLPFSVRRKDALCGSWEVTGQLSAPASSARLLILTSRLSTGLVSVYPQAPWKAQTPQD